MFVDRREELDFLNSLLTRNRPGPAQLALMFGRRRVGKSELLMQWAAQSGLPYTYWEAVKENATQQRTRLMAKLLNVPVQSAPVYRSWPELWDAAAPLLQGKRQSLILDGLPDTAERPGDVVGSYPGSALPKIRTRLSCAAHVRAARYCTPILIFGRMTAQWHLEPALLQFEFSKMGCGCPCSGIAY
jgi:AAA+ ATPase superfamily predicted ATPase